MKKNYYKIILPLVLLFSFVATSQSAQKNFINYQGVARNAENQLMANEAMTIVISLKFGASNASTVYEEEHQLTTDANGVFSLKIGGGSPLAGDYDTLSWGHEAGYLTTSLNGKIIGTTEMMAVPYAISSGDADNQSATEVPYNNSVSGLQATNTQEAIDELIGDGVVDADGDPENELQTLSFDVVTNELSLSDGNSVAIPSGGADADADPTNEIQTISFDVTTNEISLTDGGTIIIPSGGTDADADPTNEFQTLNFDVATNELGLSDGNTVTIPSGGTDADADPTNEIQTISFDVATNELSLSEGGVVTIPSGGTDADADPTNEIDVTEQNGILLGDGTTVTGLIGTTDGQVAKWDVASSSWVAGTDAMGSGGADTSSGLEALDEGNGIGWRLKNRNSDDYGNIGLNAIDLSYSAEDMVSSYGALGMNSISMGNTTRAFGAFSMAMGYYTKAEGKSSTAIGGLTRAESRNSFSIGSRNIGGGDPENWVLTDPLFEIGNGDPGQVVRSNALTVLKNGNIGIGIAVPVAKLDVEGDIRSSDLSGTGQRNVMADADGNLTIGTSGGSSGSTPWKTVVDDLYYDEGNVGIGIAPTSLHHVHSASGGSTKYTTGTTGTEILDGVQIGVTNGFSGIPIGYFENKEDGPLQFGTNNIIRMQIDNLGNIGIGSSSPTAKLDVDGSIKSSELVGTGERNVMADATGNLIIGAGSGGGTDSSGLEKITENDGSQDNTGWRLKGTSPTTYGPIGNNAVDLSHGSQASSVSGATGESSTAMGLNTKASGDYSTSLGLQTKAESLGSVAMGTYNVGGGSPGYNLLNPIFEIGSGFDEDNRSNVLTLFLNGNFIIGSSQLGDNNITADDNSRMFFDRTKGAFRAGFVDSNYWDFSEVGNSSVAFGHNTRAKGPFSVAMGLNTTASGRSSTALGQSTTASGILSAAMGNGTIASGESSFAMGSGTTAESIYSLAIGRLNIGGGSANSRVATDPLFEIGNGMDFSNRSNALTVLKNGNVGIGNHTPASILEVAHQNVQPTANDLTNALSIKNLEYKESWQLHAAHDLVLYKDGSYRGSFNSSSGAYVQASDRRVKRDITSLENGTLQKVMQLKPVSYLMKDQKDTKRNLGLISQEVKEVFPTLTHYVKEKDLLALSYTELIPILIKAVQEQQETIENLKNKIDMEDNRYGELLSRLEALEKMRTFKKKYCYAH